MQECRVLFANDCLEFKLNNEDEQALKYFMKNNTSHNALFRFKDDKSKEDDIVLAEYDYRLGKWYAGRYVGSTSFSYNNIQYELVIQPRFGNVIFFKIIEEIFNIKAVNNQFGIIRNNDSEILIKKLISMIWLKKLSAANKHGMPRKTVKKQHKGYSARGRLLVSKSAVPYYTEGKVVSQSYEKECDYVISKIILEAYNKLNRHYSLSSLHLPQNIKDIIHEIQSMPMNAKKVTENEYNSIRYKNIYQSYKEIVDFSWLIIRSRDIAQSNQKGKNGVGLFLDMAEIWEIYIKTVLEKNFKNKGWKIFSDEIEVYKDNFFKRKIIPDIIMEKDKKILVLDAKYKKMLFRKIDVDRSDFFQIHTYMSYYLSQNSLLGGGLIYPFAGEIRDKLSSSLFGESNCQASFFVEGINIEDSNKFDEAKNEFIKRIEIKLN